MRPRCVHGASSPRLIGARPHGNRGLCTRQEAQTTFVLQTQAGISTQDPTHELLVPDAGQPGRADGVKRRRCGAIAGRTDR